MAEGDYYSVMIGHSSTEMVEIAHLDPAAGQPAGWWDAAQSTLQRLAREKASGGTARITFPWAASGLPFIREGDQLWAAWRTAAGFVREDPDPPFLGFLMVDTGSGAGGEHVITCQVSGPSLINTRTTILSWPAPEDIYGPPPDAPLTMPEGYSAREWLTLDEGRAAFTGLLRVYTNNAALYDGIDDEFDTLIFDAYTMPGGGSETTYGDGAWGMTDLDTILTDLVGQIRLVWPAVEPVYWWEAGVDADGLTLRPRFRLINARDTLSKPLKGIFSTHPAAGEFAMRDFSHKRDLLDSRTYVAVTGEINPEDPLAPIVVIYDAHADAYDHEYLKGGWGGKPYYDERLSTQAQRSAAAEAIGARIWGALATVTWITDGVAEGGDAITYFRIGDVIAVDNPEEGLAPTALAIVRNVEPVAGSIGHPEWRITIGDAVPDVADIIRGATVLTPQHAPAGGGSGKGPQLGASGLPRGPKVALDRKPVHSGQNVVRSATDGAAAFTTRTAFVQPGALPVAAPDPQFRSQYYDPTSGTWRDGTWTDNQGGRPHPQVYSLVFTTSETQGPFLNAWDTDFARIKLKGTGSVTLKKNNVAAQGPFSGAGWHYFTATVHLSDAANDDWRITATGVSGDLAVTVAEA